MTMSDMIGPMTKELLVGHAQIIWGVRQLILTVEAALRVNVNDPEFRVETRHLLLGLRNFLERTSRYNL